MLELPAPEEKETKKTDTQKPIIPNPYRPNFWYSLSKVTISAMGKGQILPFGLFCLIGLYIYKIPAADLLKLGFAVIKVFTSWWLLGWLFLFITFITGLVFRYKNRKNHEAELKKKDNQIKTLEEENTKLKKKLEKSKNI